MSYARRCEHATHRQAASLSPAPSIEGDNGFVPISDHRFSPGELREREVVRQAIGAVVRRLRKVAGLSQIEVADRANMSERELRRIEKGVGGTPMDRLWPLARALNSTPAAIVLEAQQIAGAEIDRLESTRGAISARPPVHEEGD